MDRVVAAWALVGVGAVAVLLASPRLPGVVIATAVVSLPGAMAWVALRRRSRTAEQPSLVAAPAVSNL
jgi:uncharacterized membrane protein YhhN